MTDLPRHRRPQDDDSEPVDLSRLLADERALDLLAGRACDPADLDDRTLALLAAWGEQARRGEFNDAPVEAAPIRRTRGRLSPRLRGSVAGMAVTLGLLGVGSGVAAAVAGDPLAGLRGLQMAAMDTVTGHDSGTELRLSDQAVRARTALKEAQGQARSGNVAAARSITQHAQEVMKDLPTQERSALSTQASEVATAVGMAAAPTSSPAASTPQTTTPTGTAAVAAPTPSTSTASGSATTAPTTGTSPALSSTVPPAAATAAPSSSTKTFSSPSAPASSTVTTPPVSPSTAVETPSSPAGMPSGSPSRATGTTRSNEVPTATTPAPTPATVTQTTTP